MSPSFNNLAGKHFEQHHRCPRPLARHVHVLREDRLAVDRPQPATHLEHSVAEPPGHPFEHPEQVGHRGRGDRERLPPDARAAARERGYVWRAPCLRCELSALPQRVVGDRNDLARGVLCSIKSGWGMQGCLDDYSMKLMLPLL